MKNNGPIPQARARLRILQHEVQIGRIGPEGTAKELHAIEKLLYRKPPVRVAPRKTKRVDKALVEAVKQQALLWPEASMQDLAVHVGTNAGRVSEILNGKHDYLLGD